MKKYLISKSCAGVEAGIYLRNDSYYACVTLRNSACVTDVTLITDASMNISIYNPCETVITDADPMVSSTTIPGTYDYCYQIPSDAIYGEYVVDIAITSPSDCTTRMRDNFFVFPWNFSNTINQVRRLIGADSKTVDDHELAEIGWFAFIEVRDRVMELHDREKLCCCADGTCSCCGNVECACVCGTASPVTCNPFKLKHFPIADFYMDGTVRGCGCAPVADDCMNDICAFYVDSDGECQSAYVGLTGNSSSCGEINVYSNEACTILVPINNKGIFVTYRSTWRTYSINKFRKAVAYRTAYELAIRYNMVSKSVPGCNEHSKTEFADRLHKIYIGIIESMTKPQFEGID